MPVLDTTTTTTTTPSVAAPLAPVTARDLITNAMIEIAALAAGEPLSSQDAKFGLSKLNRILDNWNAERLFVFDLQFSTYTIVPGKQPHTIGISDNNPDFVVSNLRPQRIAAANLVLNNLTPNVYKPLNLRDHDWWMRVRVPTLQSNIPTDLMYHLDWPNGLIYLWPVPQIAYGLYLLTWTPLAQIQSLDTTISLPPGYEDALTLTLAEGLAGPFGSPLSPKLMSDALMARARIKSINAGDPPEMGVDNALIGTAGGYNYLIGE